MNQQGGYTRKVPSVGQVNGAQRNRSVSAFTLQGQAREFAAAASVALMPCAAAGLALAAAVPDDAWTRANRCTWPRFALRPREESSGFADRLINWLRANQDNPHSFCILDDLVGMHFFKNAQNPIEEASKVPLLRSVCSGLIRQPLGAQAAVSVVTKTADTAKISAILAFIDANTVRERFLVCLPVIRS